MVPRQYCGTVQFSVVACIRELFMPLHMEEHLDVPLRDVLVIIQERIREKTSYYGIPTRKNPLDAWVYQEIIVEAKPDVIVEVGNMFGGSTLALAHMCDILGHGKVIGLDITHEKVLDVVRGHSRVTLIEGDACENFPKVKALISPEDRVLVIEDSSHTYENTLNVLRTYSVLISPGNYLIVEDGICHHGLAVGPSPGPYEAIETFIEENSDFEIDREKESFCITWNPKGYLRRKA